MTNPKPTPGVTTDWYAIALSRAKVADIAGTRPRFTATELVLGVRAVVQYVATHGDIAALLTTGNRVDAAFLAAGTHLADDLDAAQKKVPADRRFYRVITPADEKIVADAGQFVRRLRESTADSAKALGQLTLAEHIGRNRPLDVARASSVAEAIQNFRDGAPKIAAVLADASIGAAELATLEKHATNLANLEVDKSARSGEKTAASTAVDVGRLAIETWSDLLRARARLALADDVGALGALLEHLPRLTDRRKVAKPAVVVQPAVVAEPAQSDVSE